MPSFQMKFVSRDEMAAVFGPIACLLRLAIVAGARDRPNLVTYFDVMKRELMNDFKNNWFSEGVSYQAEAQVATKIVAMIDTLVEAAKADVVKEGRTIIDNAGDDVTFRGAGPFNLPVAQRATATGHLGNGVTLTMYSLVRREGKCETEIEPINAQMIASVARELGVALLKAATESDEELK